MTKKDNNQQPVFSHEELQDILAGVKKLTGEELSKVFGGGDDREEYTLDEAEIAKDIFGTKF